MSLPPNPLLTGDNQENRRPGIPLRPNQGLPQRPRLGGNNPLPGPLPTRGEPAPPEAQQYFEENPLTFDDDLLDDSVDSLPAPARQVANQAPRLPLHDPASALIHQANREGNTTLAENIETAHYTGPTAQGIEKVNDPFLLDKDLEESAALFFQALNDDDYTEIIMNSPNEILGKKNGARFHFSSINFETVENYHYFINEKLLAHTQAGPEDKVGIANNLIEAHLHLESVHANEPPLKARVHIVAPPVVPEAKVTIAKKSRYSLTIDDLVSNDTMSRNMGEIMKALARGRVTMVFSGLSGAGKTTMLQSTSHYFDTNDRVVIVEDTPELQLPLGGALPLLAPAPKLGQDIKSVPTIEWLVRTTNRMRPDRILVGEIIDSAANEFLIAANSGADGSMTTIHAADPRRAISKLASLALKAEGVKNESSIMRDIANTVQIIVQLAEIDGKKVVTHITEVGDTIHQATGQISSTSIFEYDREHRRFVYQNPISEKLRTFLAHRDVELDQELFS